MPETPGAPKQEIKLFYCYAREDKALRDELEIHLSNLKRQYHLTNWHDREILPGENWEQAIDTHLSTAHLILLLISPHFMASDYCYGKEMTKALEREKADTCRVIPILLRPTDWEDAPFSHLQMLPTDARPITSWIDRDSALWDIAKEIRKAIKELLVALKTKEQWLREGTTLHDLMRDEEALIAFEQAIRLDPKNADAYNGKGTALHDLKQYQEALIAFEQAIRLDPNFAIAYRNKGITYYNLKRYEEALIAFDQAIRLDPNFAIAYYNRGNALRDLKRYEEALTAYEQALRLDPNYALAYYNKGLLLQTLGRSKEAQQVFEKSRQLGYNG